MKDLETGWGGGGVEIANHDLTLIRCFQQLCVKEYCNIGLKFIFKYLKCQEQISIEKKRQSENFFCRKRYSECQIAGILQALKNGVHYWLQCHAETGAKVDKTIWEAQSKVYCGG